MDYFRPGALGRLAALTAAVLALFGCATVELRCTAPDDNPRYNYEVGLELLDQGDIDAARAKFERSRYCLESFGPSYAGLALAAAAEAASARDAGARSAGADQAFSLLSSAWKNASTPQDEFAYHLAAVRVNTLVKPEGWVDEAASAYARAKKIEVADKALLFYRDKEAADYFMGAAYYEAGRFGEARKMFSNVISSRPRAKWHKPAERYWSRTDKVLRATAGAALSGIGGEIALKSSVTRAELAVLMVDEFGLGMYLSREEVEVATPSDIITHPFKEEVLAVLNWGIKGFETDTSVLGKVVFRPDQVVTRKEMAVILQDIVVKLTGKDDLAVAFYGHTESPFIDVSTVSTWYNAVVTVTTRNLMDAGLLGDFRPNKPVDGADAVLALRVLRQKLTFF